MNFKRKNWLPLEQFLSFNSIALRSFTTHWVQKALLVKELYRRSIKLLPLVKMDKYSFIVALWEKRIFKSFANSKDLIYPKELICENQFHTSFPTNSYSVFVDLLRLRNHEEYKMFLKDLEIFKKDPYAIMN